MKAVNTAGEAKADSMLDVMGKPKPPKVVKEIEPAEVVIPGKRDIKLNCKIAGFPAPTIKWYRDGNEIKVRCFLDQFSFIIFQKPSIPEHGFIKNVKK